MSATAAELPTTRSLGKIMSGVAPAGLFVQLCSFASSIALARVLGATVSTDAYYLGLSIPVLAYGLYMGALRQGAIPALTSASADTSPGALSRAAGDLLRGATMASAGLTIVVVGAAEALFPFVAHGKLLGETRLVLLELAPYGVLGAATGVLGAILAVRGAFVLPVLVVALESLLKVVLVVAFGREIGIQALVLGSLGGSALAVAVLLGATARRGLALRLWGPLFSPFLRSVVALSLPLLASMSVLQVNPLIDRTMASEVGAGKVTALELGLRLFLVPAGLVTSLLVAPVTATWAARYATGGWNALRESALRAARGMVYVIPPIVVAGVVLRRQIVDLMFAGGAYSPTALHDTAAVLGMILIALPAQALIVLMSSIFVVQRDTVFPMKVAFANVVLNVALNFAFRGPFGVAGIALSTSLTYTILLIVYVLAVRRRWGSILGGGARTLGLVAASVALTTIVALWLRELLPGAHTRIDALFAIVVVGAGAVGAHGLILLFARRLGVARRARYDVVLYAPAIAPLLATNDVGSTGGAETQILLIARLLARHGLDVCLCTYDVPGANIPQRVDGVDVVLRAPYVRSGKIQRVREATALVRDLFSLDARVYVTRIASYHVGLVALAARLRGRRFLYSSAHVLDFDFRKLSPPLRDRVLYRLGLTLASAIVVQTDEQAILCRRRTRRQATVIRNLVERAEPARGPRDVFLWIGRAVWYKAPLKYVELARELPEANFIAVCPPGPRTEDLTEAMRVAAADVPNLEILPPRPRRELAPLFDRAVAVVNTSLHEGMPNATLEGWARGIPSLTLAHDPDGVISRLRLGEYADGSWSAFVAGARMLWRCRSDGAPLARRCREHVLTEHGEDSIAEAWLRVLGLRPAAEKAAA